MSVVRSIIAAGVVAFAGFAASAHAAPFDPAHKLKTGPQLAKPHFKAPLCFPHYERKVIHRINYRIVVVIYVDRFCRRHVVRVHRIPTHHRYGAR